MSENTNNTMQMSTNELEARLQKAQNIRNRDGVVWKDKFDRSHTILSARDLSDGAEVKLAGRYDEVSSSRAPAEFPAVMRCPVGSRNFVPRP